MKTDDVNATLFNRYLKTYPLWKITMRRSHCHAPVGVPHQQTTPTPYTEFSVILKYTVVEKNSAQRSSHIAQ